jgi:2,4-dienoyl-CoA reductase-like NADH-dependent reductase (Old Yellow Enzyme family)
MTKVITDSKAHFWAQLNHSGRQTSYMINVRPKSASDIWLKRGGFYAKPKAMNEDEILEVIENFGNAARRCIQGGFTGIQIHAAHGYLLNQFLSPLTNKRQDQWGGSIENRARLLISIVDKCRQIIGDELALSVKLNSADFLKGGFDEEDSIRVIKMLEDKIDLLEISGGTYEKQAMMGEHQSNSTQKREAYFLDFAKRVRQLSRLPLMVTGGFRTREGISAALEGGHMDIAGLARPFCTKPEDMNDFLNGKIGQLGEYFSPAKSSYLRFSSEGGYYARQIVLLAEGKTPDLLLSGDQGGRFVMAHELKKAFIKRLFGK